MPNILDYVQTNQAKSFEELALNELDIAVLNELAYLPLSKEQEARIKDRFLPLKELVDLSSLSVAEDKTSFMVTENRLGLLDAVLGSSRYETVAFGYYVNDVNSLFEKQFAAVIAHIPDLAYFQLIFRGTDETLIGWKEDFNMTYMSEIPAQRSACQYLTGFLEKQTKPITISGHSKGGNLAVYAASFIPAHLQDLVDIIYIFDSPGLHEHVLEKAGYQDIRQRIKAYKPKESIVGVMLASDIPSFILESTARGILQHDIFQWQIDQHCFSRVEELTHLSKSLQKTFNEWMKEYSKHELKEMSDTFFELFFSLGIDNLDDLKAVDLKTTKAFLEGFSGLNSRKKGLLFDALKTMLGIYHQHSIDLTVEKGKILWQDWLTGLQREFDKLIDKTEKPE